MYPDHFTTSDLQFGFKRVMSTSDFIKKICAYINGSPVFGCFLDASKTFDRVNYDTVYVKSSLDMYPDHFTTSDLQLCLPLISLRKFVHILMVLQSLVASWMQARPLIVLIMILYSQSCLRGMFPTSELFPVFWVYKLEDTSLLECLSLSSFFR